MSLRHRHCKAVLTRYVCSQNPGRWNCTIPTGEGCQRQLSPHFFVFTCHLSLFAIPHHRVLRHGRSEANEQHLIVSTQVLTYLCQ